MSIAQMNDRELVTQLKATGSKALQEELWTRYQNLVHKNWAILRRQMDNSALILGMKDDFYSESFVAFRKTLDAVNMTKVHDDNWKFLGYFRLYLKNVRSDMISDLIKTYHHEKSYFVETSTGEEVARIELSSDTTPENHKFDPVTISENNEGQRRCEEALASCMSHWNAKRQQIYRWREQGISKSNIAKKLEVHPATITYYMQSMQKDLETALKLK